MELKTAHDLLNEAVEKAKKLRDDCKKKSELDIPPFPGADAKSLADKDWQKKYDRWDKFDIGKHMKQCDEYFAAYLHYDQVCNELTMLHFGLKR